MRYSFAQRLKVSEPPQDVDTNTALFEYVAAKTTAARRRCSILLVGGRSHADLLIRRAQAALRLDRQPSYWSHAAMLLNWGRGDVANAVGAEVTLEPADRTDQVPERNGVTLFRLARYLDPDRYPNVCVATFDLAEPAAASETSAKGRRKKTSPKKGKRGQASATGPATVPNRKARAMDAVYHPNSDRLRFPFWDWLGVWARYMYTPESCPNPIIEGIPLPAAAFCEHVFEAADLDLTPGATAPNACPETLWSTFMHWHEGLAEYGAKMRLFRLVRDEACPAREALDPQITKKDLLGK